MAYPAGLFGVIGIYKDIPVLHIKEIGQNLLLCLIKLKILNRIVLEESNDTS
ncbi:hypothetical protein FACS189442_4560 [Spirochaetia bacterium]|nr:hypothetical protein FACS189442_4560 [Spirochaetia bacterium]